MKAFREAEGTMLPINFDNVDTDTIIPQRWLVTLERHGLADGFLGAWRYDEYGEPCLNFVLNQPAYREASILLAGENYGCGSSREHAVWAHLEYGIHAIIARSFGPIFYENCLKNGLIPVVLPAGDVAALMKQAQTCPNTGCKVSLEALSVISTDGVHRPFTFDPGRRRLLLEGIDDIDLALQYREEINRFQQRQEGIFPWLR